MSTTDQRTGFRFPWESPAAPRRPQDDETSQGQAGEHDASERAAVEDQQASGQDDGRAQMITQIGSEADASATDAGAGTAEPSETSETSEAAEATAEPSETSETSEAAEASAEPGPDTEPEVAADAATAQVSPDPETPSETTAPDSSAGAHRSAGVGRAQAKSNRLMADLVRAMRTAAEESREANLEQVRGDAKSQVELIHSRSGDEVVELRRKSDEDVASVREWSKAEIARIRSEADSQVEHCKQTLETALQAHAAAVERQIERVQAEVQRFETEMTSFFEQLEHIDDLGAFAAAAAHLPEPPDLAELVAEQATLTSPEAILTSEAVEAPEAEATAGIETGPDLASPAEEAATADTLDPSTGEAEASARAEAAAEAEASAEAEATAEAKAAAEVETDAVTEALAASPDEDPRLAVLRGSRSGDVHDGQTLAGSTADDDPSLGEDALAARLGILGIQVETTPSPSGAPEEATGANATTRVVVVGLVSVSSIASFKRHVAGIEGVRTVGVSSGPDGEFVFKVEHDPVLQLQDVLPTLPGFAARVVSSADGTIQVAASDPDLRD
ncbi:MAG TPA: hypothetical protein VFW92_07265 [Candidatus Limnocylindrales bacterium]|nr:hypothetical protein [Candidatus Limnocylindrales bacterium]